MTLPLAIHIWFTLRRAAKALSNDALDAVRSFVQSQKRLDGYCGPGGKVEAYYTVFGKALTPALSLNGEGVLALLSLVKDVIFGDNVLSPLPTKAGADGEGMYALFFNLMNNELRLKRTTFDLTPFRLSEGGYIHAVGRPEASTNATCAALAMLHQKGRADESSLRWLLERQDDTGGFRATADAPVPDLLSTAVALFTLRLCGRSPRISPHNFIEAHWLENGGFAPTILDDYSDVEYVFYGLLALGSAMK